MSSHFMSNSMKLDVQDVKNDSKLGLIVDERFKLGQLIGSGSFGELRQAEDINTKQLVAIKLEVFSDNEKLSQLQLEYNFYKMLGTPEEGFPQVFYYGRCGPYNAMALELLGRNLDDIFDSCGHQFSLKTIIYIFLQLLQRIEYVHNCHLIYRDIKPENLLLGREGREAKEAKEGTPKKNENIIHLIDFGLAKQYRNADTGVHIPMCEGKLLTGTLRYMSINAHLGKELSRRDDLEAIGYVIMYFLKQGKLPWSGLKAQNIKERHSKIAAFKRGTPIETLCYGFPEQFADYLRYVRMLDFNEDPDYKHMKNPFIKLFQNFVDNGVYDWNSKFSQ